MAVNTYKTPIADLTHLIRRMSDQRVIGFQDANNAELVPIADALPPFEEAVYNAQGKLLSAKINGVQHTITYNANGQASEIQIGPRKVTVTWDEYGRLTGIK